MWSERPKATLADEVELRVYDPIESVRGAAEHIADLSTVAFWASFPDADDFDVPMRWPLVNAGLNAANMTRAPLDSGEVELFGAYTLEHRTYYDYDMQKITGGLPDFKNAFLNGVSMWLSIMGSNGAPFATAVEIYDDRVDLRIFQNTGDLMTAMNKELKPCEVILAQWEKARPGGFTPPEISFLSKRLAIIRSGRS